MKKLYFIIAIVCSVSIFSCKKDDGESCVTCNSAETTNFEVCEKSNGNASVNGQDTGTPYNTYISLLESTGTICQ